MSPVPRLLGRLRPGRRRRQNPDGTMTLIEHLYELRNRIGIALVAIGVTTVFGYVWFGVGLFGTPSLGEILKAPYCSIPAASREGDCRPSAPITSRVLSQMICDRMAKPAAPRLSATVAACRAPCHT